MPSVVYFPGEIELLHIFEPRYRQMLGDALDSHCMICVGTLTNNETEDPTECTAKTGTIGLIRVSKEQENGRSNLILHGILRVDFTNWLEENEYPYAAIEPSPSEPIPEDEIDQVKAALQDALYLALKNFPDTIVDRIKKSLGQVDSSSSALADVVAQQFVVDPDKRRDLLEEPDVKKRFEMLTREIGQADWGSSN